MIFERKDCRLCGGDLRRVLSLTPTPLANSFPDTPDKRAERYPLDLMQCLNCEHVQLSHVADAETLYSDYKYSTPDAVKPHMRDAIANLRLLYPLAKTILEIGSNNGLYTQMLREAGFTVVGVDPSAPEGTGTIMGYFSDVWAKWALERFGKFDLILANNVFAHINNLQAVFAGVDVLLKDDGALVFEVQYLPDMVRKGAFDMIYHEHHDYHTLSPLRRFLPRHGLVIKNYEGLPTHGGSIRVYCERPGIPLVLPREQIDWRRFKARIDLEREVCRRAITGPVVAFGATAKATTLIHHFGIADKIAFAVDSTPQKLGRYIPGTNIQILPESEIKDSTLFLTAWNYADVIRAKYPNPMIVPFEQQALRVAA